MTETKATLTQWMVQREKCACGKPDAPSTQSEFLAVVPVLLCRKCNKRYEDARKGSLTQWIFQSHICSCEVPEPVEVVGKQELHRNVDLPAGAGEIAYSEDVELQIGAADFPIDRYAPLQLLGSGASATVYMCRDRLLGIKVAIKVLHRLSSEQLILFQQEARAIAKMDHPVIVRLLDFGPTNNGSPYMVLENFRGKSLDEVRSATTLNVRQVIDILARISQGLSHAHAHGILHRDLKPSNILLDLKVPVEPVVKIIDFGLSRIESEDPGAGRGRQSSTIAGTPQFMSPDVLQGLDYDVTSEIYSLGCILFFALTGKAPFSGGTALETMSLHAHAEVPDVNSSGQERYPEALNEIIRKCMAKSKEHRFQTVEELEQSLRDIALKEYDSAEQNTPAIKASSNKRNPIVLVTAAAAIFGVLIYGGIVLVRHENDKTTKSELSEPKNELNVLEKHESDLDRLLERANKGDKGAQSTVGDMYYSGQTIARNLDQSLRWYSAAARSGDIQSMNKVGWMYEHGEGTSADALAALKFYRQAANRGSVAAQQNLTRLLFIEYGKTNDKSLRLERIEWLKKLAERNDSNAQYWLSQEYRFGEILPKDLARATELAKTAANNGSKQASLVLAAEARHRARYAPTARIRKQYEEEANRYLKNTDANDTVTRLSLLVFDGSAKLKMVGDGAEESYMEEAKSGSAMGMVRLADCYLFNSAISKRLRTLNALNAKTKGTTTTSEITKKASARADEISKQKNYTKAAFWYRKAADKNFCVAQNNLGFMYDSGIGVKQDIERAFELFKAAATDPAGKTMDPYAQVNLGRAYELGRGTKVDYAEAAKWYHEAADAKIPEAELRLGMMYKRGLGVPRDEKLAASWLKRAAFHGNTPAKNLLYGSGKIEDIKPTCCYNEYFTTCSEGETKYADLRKAR